jgi:hypothetical protein
MYRFVAKSKQEFLDRIKKASIIIFPMDTSLPIWNEIGCSVGWLNMQIISYGKYEVIEVLPQVAVAFMVFWSRRPDIKYYFINKLDENDKRGAVIPAKSNEIVEKWFEDELK